MTLATKETLPYETKIVWLHDPKDYPWVREASCDFPTRSGLSQTERKRFDSDREQLIGYSELDENAPASFIDDLDGSQHFYRRTFMVRKGDYEAYPKHDCPIEAVDPLSAEPGVLGLSYRKKAQIAVRIPIEVQRKLNSHTQRTGVSQTEVVVEALKAYLGASSSTSLIERIVRLEKRVAALEA